LSLIGAFSEGPAVVGAHFGHQGVFGFFPFVAVAEFAGGDGIRGVEELERADGFADEAEALFRVFDFGENLAGVGSEFTILRHQYQYFS